MVIGRQFPGFFLTSPSFSTSQGSLLLYCVCATLLVYEHVCANGATLFQCKEREYIYISISISIYLSRINSYNVYQSNILKCTSFTLFVLSHSTVVTTMQTTQSVRLNNSHFSLYYYLGAKHFQLPVLIQILNRNITETSHITRLACHRKAATLC